MRIYKFLIIFCLLAIVSIPNVSFAHSTIEKTSPEAGAVLDKSPDAIEVWFGDYVDLHKNSITITANNKVDVELEPAAYAPGDREHIIAKLKKPLPYGKYTVNVSVISIDSHPIKNSYQLEIRNPNPSPQEAFDNLRLDHMSPGDGEIAPTSPRQLELWYTEAAKITAFGIYDDNGNEISVDKPLQDPADPKHHIVNIKEPLHDGSYSVYAYAGIGTNEKLSIHYFAVGKYSSMQIGNGIPTENILKKITLQTLGHWLSYVGLFVLTGLTFFQLFIAKNTGDGGRLKQARLGLLATFILGMMFELWTARSQNEAITLREYISYSFVWIPIVQLLLTIIAIWIARGNIRLILLILAVSAFGFTGHSASSTYGGLLGISIDVLHLLAVTIWLGGIIGLVLMAPKEEMEDWLKSVGARFSKWALGSIIVLAITGTWLTLKYVPAFTLESFYKSSWGKMILVKTVLLLGIMAIGFWQRKHLTRLAAASIRFVRNLRLELAIGAIVLFAAAILVDQSPREAEQRLVPDSMVVDGVKASVTITPLKVGANEIKMVFDRTDFKKVNVVLSMPPMLELENTAFSLGNGEYRLTGNVLHSPGTIFMVISAQEENGNVIKFPFEVHVPGVDTHEH